MRPRGKDVFVNVVGGLRLSDPGGALPGNVGDSVGMRVCCCSAQSDAGCVGAHVLAPMCSAQPTLR